MQSSHLQPLVLRQTFPCIPILLLSLLLAFPALSVKGAANGLLLWFQTVLPTLAPFMICTQMIMALDGVSLLIKPFAPLLRTLFSLSNTGCYVLLCGLLCGYPLGAKLCGDLYRDGALSHKEASYLLSICNHPSPMFLLGYVRGQLPPEIPVLLLLVCIYFPILPLSLLSRRLYRFSASAQAASSPKSTAFQNRSLESILLSTAETMVLIGGYMMLFSILAAWIGSLSMIPASLQALLSGAAEITTGVHLICQIFPPETVLLSAAAVTAFGGFSGIFQTKGVLSAALKNGNTAQKNAGLSIRHYVLWKLLHAVLTCLVLLTAEFLLQFLPR